MCSSHVPVLRACVLVNGWLLLPDERGTLSILREKTVVWNLTPKEELSAVNTC